MMTLYKLEKEASILRHFISIGQKSEMHVKWIVRSTGCPHIIEMSPISSALSNPAQPSESNSNSLFSEKMPLYPPL